jgi:hypothetical protein
MDIDSNTAGIPSQRNINSRPIILETARESYLLSPSSPRCAARQYDISLILEEEVEEESVVEANLNASKPEVTEDIAKGSIQNPSSPAAENPTTASTEPHVTLPSKDLATSSRKNSNDGQAADQPSTALNATSDLQPQIPDTSNEHTPRPKTPLSPSKTTSNEHSSNNGTSPCRNPIAPTSPMRSGDEYKIKHTSSEITTYFVRKYVPIHTRRCQHNGGRTSRRDEDGVGCPG